MVAQHEINRRRDEIAPSVEIPRKHPLIIIVGPTGSGKTTLSELLAGALNAHLFEEEPRDNPFLNRYYEGRLGRLRWGFHSQTFFLAQAADQSKEIPGILTNQAVVIDGSFINHRMYADILRQDGDFELGEAGLYNQLFGLLSNLLPKADLIVVVKSTLEQIRINIEKRVREDPTRLAELGIDPDYLRKMIDYWERWIANPPPGVNFIVIDGARNNWVEDESHQQAVLGEIKEKLQSIGF